MTIEQEVTVLPEMLGRHDVEHGPWSVHECAPLRGLPYSDLVERSIAVPVGATETERCIRAHEMMHAKVSPGSDYERWVQRGVASEQALRVVEELRVNYLCNVAGFNVKKHLHDGGEALDGERCAIAGDWAAAVYGAVAYAETASLNQFITGVRRHNPEWAASLRAIAQRVVKTISRVNTALLSSTGVNPDGMSPAGFKYTEQIAEFVDRMANPPTPEEDEDTTDEGSPGKGAPSGSEVDGADGKPKPAPVSTEQVKKMKPSPDPGHRNRRWATLKPHRLPLNRPAPGGLGKRRSPTTVGRSPRRIERMLTDPHRRIFDRTTRGNGGVVLIDGSGSMQLSQADVRHLVEAAPGATVAVYCADNDTHPVNLWVLADRGRMVSEMPERWTGNSVDLPAIEWAVQQRKRRSTPVIWVTDGYVISLNQTDHEWDAFECLKVCLREKVILRPDVKSALEALVGLQKNRRPKPWWPGHWRSAHAKFQGSVLRSTYRPKK